MNLSKQHFKHLRRLRQKKYREIENAILIEGVRLCEEALLSQANVQEIIISQEQWTNERAITLLNNFHAAGIPVLYTDADTLSALADTQAPQGIIAVVKKRPLPAFASHKCHDTLILAIDGLADPGNLGTILRTADWFGVKTLLFSAQTVELYNPKVVRSSMGSIFRLAAHESINLDDTLAEARKAGYHILAADSSAGVPVHTLRLTQKTLLIIGSEAHGLTSTLRPMVDMHVNIPRLGGGESLNAATAASILLYQLSLP